MRSPIKKKKKEKRAEKWKEETSLDLFLVYIKKQQVRFKGGIRYFVLHSLKPHRCA